MGAWRYGISLRVFNSIAYKFSRRLLNISAKNLKIFRLKNNTFSRLTFNKDGHGG